MANYEEIKYPRTLTLYGCPQAVASRLISDLSSNKGFDYTRAADYICVNTIRCKELDKLGDKYHHKYEETLKRLLKESKDLISEFDSYSEYESAIENDVYSDEYFCHTEYDARLLIHAKTKGFKFDWRIVHQFGWDVLYFFARSSYPHDRVERVDSQDVYRSTSEKVCSMGLGFQGTAIRMESILDRLTIDQLKDILQGTDFKKSWKKSELISFLVAQPDHFERINNKHPLSDFFLFSPCPSDVIDAGLKDAVDYWGYCKEVSKFITYCYYADSHPPACSWHDEPNTCAPACS